MRKNDATNVGVFGVEGRMSRRRAMRIGMGAAALALGLGTLRLGRAQEPEESLVGGTVGEPDDASLLAAPRALVVSDHTKIMQLAITRRPDINPAHVRTLTAEAALAKAMAIARNPTEAELAQASMNGVHTHLLNMRLASGVSNPITVAGNNVYKKVVAHTGTPQTLAIVLRGEAALIADVGLKAGVITASNIIADGISTIYNSDWWQPLIHDPRQIWGQLESIGADLGRLRDYIFGVAREDAKGAVTGAIGGAVAGAAGGPKAAAVAATLGAIGGAIGNSVVAVIF